MHRRIPTASRTRAIAAVLAAVLAVTASSALPSIVWCAAERSTHLSCCCPRVDRTTDSVRAACCESRSIEHDVLAAREERGVRIAPFLPVAAIAEIAIDAPPAPVIALGPRPFARAGPTIRLHARHSIYLL